METANQILIDALAIVTRHASERSQQINKEVKNKRVLMLIHKSDIATHVPEQIDSNYIMSMLLLKHKSEKILLHATSKKEWNKLLSVQKKEMKNHTKNNI